MRFHHHRRVGAPRCRLSDEDVNARIAQMLDAPVLMVTGGGLGNVIDKIYMGLALFEKEGVDVRAVLANKLVPEKRERTLDYLTRALADEKMTVIGGVDYYPVL